MSLKVWMTARNRSFSASSESTISIRRAGSEGRFSGRSAIDYAYFRFVRFASKNGNFSHHRNGPLHSFWRHTRPVQTVDQHRQLRRRQRHDAVADRRPGQATFLQPLTHPPPPPPLPPPNL